MIPAHPPPPTNWNLPFQPSAEAGNQASISISESGDGRRIALTRQCAGNICWGAGGPPGPPRPRPRPSTAAAGAAAGAGPRPCATKGPAGTISAATTVVFGSASDFSDSQGAGDEASVAESASAASIEPPDHQIIETPNIPIYSPPCTKACRSTAWADSDRCRPTG